MEKRKKYLEENVDLIKGQSECESACTRGTRRILAYNIDGYFLKSIAEKRKRRYFRERVSAKAAVFSGFKSVK
jgi:hypothetical protein